jgi:hypothetical protein
MVKIGEVMGFFDVAKPMPFLHHKPPAPPFLWGSMNPPQIVALLLAVPKQI